MADVPAKLNYNESIRRIPEKVNEILDYLKRTRIQVDPRTMRKTRRPPGLRCRRSARPSPRPSNSFRRMVTTVISRSPTRARATHSR